MTNPITSAILQSHSEQEREKKSRWNQREVGLSEEKKIFNVSDSWENAKIWMNLLHFYSFHSGIILGSEIYTSAKQRTGKAATTLLKISFCSKILQSYSPVG